MTLIVSNPFALMRAGLYHGAGSARPERPKVGVGFFVEGQPGPSPPVRSMRRTVSSPSGVRPPNSFPILFSIFFNFNCTGWRLLLHSIYGVFTAIGESSDL